LEVPKYFKTGSSKLSGREVKSKAENFTKSAPRAQEN